MEYTIEYKNIKHAYVRVKNGKLAITMSKRMQGNQKILDSLLQKGEKLLLAYKNKWNITTFGKNGTTLFGEEVSREDLGLEGKSQATKEKHLKKMLLEYTTDLVQHYEQKLSELVGKKYTSKKLTIKKLKAKRGYCTSDQDIVFALQLLHVPNSWIRYVVVHEVCHLKQKDHSPKFWKLVGELYPEYKHIKRKMGDVILD